MKHGLTKATLIKCINELKKLKLLHVIQHTERNKTKYKIDYDNLNELQKIIKKSMDKKASKTLANKKQFQRVVINLYNEYLKNNTTSSDKFNTTEKDLIEKDLKRKRNKCSKTFSTENDTPTIRTINYYNNKVFDESITYYYIPMLFKESENKDAINDFLCNTNHIHKEELNTLEYFLYKYHERYGEYHKKIDIVKLRELTQQINEVLEKPYINNDTDIMTDIINEYFNTKNAIKSRELTLYLFLSKNKYGLYSWIDTIYTRLYGGT